MTDFDLSKITGREPPLVTDDEELDALRAEVAALREWQREAVEWMLAARDKADQAVNEPNHDERECYRDEVVDIVRSMAVENLLAKLANKS